MEEHKNVEINDLPRIEELDEKVLKEIGGKGGTWKDQVEPYVDYHHWDGYFDSLDKATQRDYYSAYGDMFR